MNPSNEIIVLFEDEAALSTEPLSLTRPIWDLRCGLRSLREKITAYFPGVQVFELARPFLKPILKNPWDEKRQSLDDALFINGALIPGKGLSQASNLPAGGAWMSENRVIAFRGTKPGQWAAGTQIPADQFNKMDAPENVGMLIRYPWDLINAMNTENTNEARELLQLGLIEGEVSGTASLVNESEVFIGPGCMVAPGVVIDASLGPVALEKNVIVGANTVIEGPTFLGPGTQVKPLTHIRGSSLGEQCRVGGEISVSIMQGFSNKQHGGFLGHSYIGSWCNLGSGTETSNLKNNYSYVKVQIGTDLIDSGELFVGLTMGDHSKSAIGTVFNTGTVVGVGCIIFGAGFPPRHVPSFNWGGTEKLTPYPLKPTLETVRQVMRRRHLQLSQGEIDVLTWIHKNRISLTRQLSTNNEGMKS